MFSLSVSLLRSWRRRCWTVKSCKDQPLQLRSISSSSTKTWLTSKPSIKTHSPTWGNQMVSVHLIFPLTANFFLPQVPTIQCSLSDLLPGPSSHRVYQLLTKPSRAHVKVKQTDQVPSTWRTLPRHPLLIRKLAVTSHFTAVTQHSGPGDHSMETLHKLFLSHSFCPSP